MLTSISLFGLCAGIPDQALALLLLLPRWALGAQCRLRPAPVALTCRTHVGEAGGQGSRHGVALRAAGRDVRR